MVSRIRFSLWILAATLAAAVPQSAAQGTLADYQRADSLRIWAERSVYNTPQNLVWIGSSHRFVYRRETGRGREFILVDTDQKSSGPAFDHEQLADSLSAVTGREYRADRLPFKEIHLSEDGNTLRFRLEGVEFTCDLTDYCCRRITKTDSEEKRRNRLSQNDNTSHTVISPDSSREAFIRDFNVFVRRRDDSRETRLSFDGNEGDYYSDDFLWSPDSRKLVTRHVKPGFERRVYYIESSPEDQLQPKLTSRVYPKPGDNITIRKPALFDVATGRQLPLDDSLFHNPYYISDIEWYANSRGFTFQYNQRGHQVYRVIEVDATSGTPRALVDEHSETFFCYYGKLFCRLVSEGQELIWMSERDGWNHLYLYDTRTGKVKNRITQGRWVVRRVLWVDETRRRIYFYGSGREKGEDPYYLNLYRVNFDGSGLIRLTSGRGTHQVIFSLDHEYFTDLYSEVNSPPRAELRRTEDGGLVMKLERTDTADLLALGWQAPEPFCAKGRDGVNDIWGVIWRPTTFDPAKKYRVIEYIYAGPHNSFVPKSFNPWFSQQSLTELGFIVVQIDGMGTSNRSKAFHDVCYKNIKDAGFPDRILWHQALARKYPWYNIKEGVGIYGHSAGGQNSTGALLFHPDFYTVAVSSCGCHDNRMDKISWNEQWMGYPVGQEYADNSNVTHASRLEGKLFLIVGEMDTNVDPSSTMQLVNALVKAKKDFDLLVLPGVGHSIGGDYGERRRRDFFVRNLLGVSPPDWNRLLAGEE